MGLGEGKGAETMRLWNGMFGLGPARTARVAVGAKRDQAQVERWLRGLVRRRVL